MRRCDATHLVSQSHYNHTVSLSSGFDKGNEPKRVVAVTACPTGVAHTFMAAEALETEAKKTRLVD